MNKIVQFYTKKKKGGLKQQTNKNGHEHILEIRNIYKKNSNYPFRASPGMAINSSYKFKIAAIN
jgi:hypothetical protein